MVLPFIRKNGAYIDPQIRRILETNPNFIHDLNQRVAFLKLLLKVNQYKLERAEIEQGDYRDWIQFYRTIFASRLTSDETNLAMDPVEHKVQLYHLVDRSKYNGHPIM